MVWSGHSLQVKLQNNDLRSRLATPFVQNISMVFAVLLAFYVFLQLLTVFLKILPEPIGSRAELFSTAAQVTLLLTLWSSIFGLLIGVLVGLAKLSRLWFMRYPAAFYVWLIRGTPLLVQVLFVFLALPEIIKTVFVPLHLLGQDWSGFPDFWTGVLALSVNIGAYNAEIVRGAVLAIPHGQREAAHSLGLTSLHTMSDVILPQAFKIALPPLVNNLVGLLKDSSQVSVIGVLELLLQTQRVGSETFLPVPVLSTAAGVYLVMTSVMTFFTNILERRFHESGKR
jgi:polar amino acid transport system permease protein